MTNYKLVIGACAAVLAAICAYYGVSAESLTSWQAVGDLALDVASNPVAIVTAMAALSAFITKRKDVGK